MRKLLPFPLVFTLGLAANAARAQSDMADMPRMSQPARQGSGTSTTWAACPSVEIR